MLTFYCPKCKQYKDKVSSLRFKILNSRKVFSGHCPTCNAACKITRKSIHNKIAKEVIVTESGGALIERPRSPALRATEEFIDAMTAVIAEAPKGSIEVSKPKGVVLDLDNVIEAKIDAILTQQNAKLSP